MKKEKILFFLFCAFAWSWTNWFIGLSYLTPGINDESIGHFVRFFFIGVYGPAIAALVSTIYFDGSTGVVRLLKRLLIWKVPFTIYLVIVLLPILLLASGIALYALCIGTIGGFDTHAFALLPALLLNSIYAGPLGEELGWRGLLLPELMKRLSPLKASLIVGFIWFTWHTPLFFAPFGTLVSGTPLSFLPLLTYLFFVLSLSCINTWLFLHAQGSVLVAILFHLSVNAGIILVFFPGLMDQYKLLYLQATPLAVICGIYAGTKLPKNSTDATALS